MDIKPTLKHFWTWRKSGVWCWGEAIGLTLITLLFCYYLSPANPLFIKGVFPWPWIASIIVVFQYGFGPGLLSIVIIYFAAIFQNGAGTVPVSDLQAYLLSGTTLVLICALFSSSWARRMMNAEVLQAYNDERLKSLSRSFYMLRVSSEYLEQNIITKPMTLRLALKELQKLNIQSSEQLSPDVAAAFLQLVSQFCMVNAAGIYLHQNKTLEKEPFVQIGMMGPLEGDDPLIKRSVETGEISYVNLDEIEDASECNYLVVIPLITNDNRLMGVFAIKDMSFWNLNEETLRTLSIIVYFFIKEIIVNSDIEKFIQQYPGCSVDFARQLTTLIPLKKDMDIDSALIAILVSKDLRKHNVMDNLKNQQRLLDSWWVLESGNYDVIITLMPFTASAGVLGYKNRITRFLVSDSGLPLDGEQIKMRSMQLYNDEAINLIKYYLNFIKE